MNQMKLFQLVTLLVLILAACTPKDQLPESGFVNEDQDWTLQEELMDTSVSITSNAVQSMILKIDEGSLCNRYNLKINVTIDNAVALDTKVDTFPFISEFELELNDEIDIQTSIIENNTGIQCVWFGESKILLSFDQ